MAAWLAVQVLAHNLARWTARIGLGEQIVTTKTLRRRFFCPGRTAHPLGAPADPASSQGLAMGGEGQSRLGPVASHFHSRPDGARPPVSQRPRKLNLPANSRQSGPRAPLAVSSPAISLTTATVGRHRRPQKRLQTAANPPSIQIRARTIALVTPSPPLPAPSRRPSVDSGLAATT